MQNKEIDSIVVGHAPSVMAFVAGYMFLQAGSRVMLRPATGVQRVGPVQTAESDFSLELDVINRNFTKKGNVVHIICDPWFKELYLMPDEFESGAFALKYYGLGIYRVVDNKHGTHNYLSALEFAVKASTSIPRGYFKRGDRLVPVRQLKEAIYDAQKDDSEPDNHIDTLEWIISGSASYVDLLSLQAIFKQPDIMRYCYYVCINNNAVRNPQLLASGTGSSILMTIGDKSCATAGGFVSDTQIKAMLKEWVTDAGTSNISKTTPFFRAVKLSRDAITNMIVNWDEPESVVQAEIFVEGEYAQTPGSTNTHLFELLQTIASAYADI